MRQKAQTRQAPPQTQESLLASLAHYVQTKDQPVVVKKEENENEDTAAKVSSQALNPFGKSFYYHSSKGYKDIFVIPSYPNLYFLSNNQHFLSILIIFYNCLILNHKVIISDLTRQIQFQNTT